MIKRSLFLLILVILLVSCASGATTTSEPTTAPAIQPSPTMAQAVDPTQASDPPQQTTAPDATNGSAVAYQIVPGESTLQYEVGEVFINENNRFNSAIGVTPQISGQIMVDSQKPQNSSIGTITADISQFQSDSSRRDNAIRQRFLQSSTYPMVTFAATQIDGLPESYQEGQEVKLTVQGDLTIREATRPVSFDVTLQLAGSELTGTATTTILMSDFGFGPINVAGILKTEDKAVITLNFVARAQN